MFIDSLLWQIGQNFESDTESLASVHQCQIKSQKQSFGRNRKEWLYSFARQWGPSRFLPPKTRCPNAAVVDEEFYSNGSRVGLLSSLGCVKLCYCCSVQLFATLWTTARHASLSFTSSRRLLRFKSTESVMQPKLLVLCWPLLLLPSVFPSIRVFSKELALCIRWANYWSFSFSINPSNEQSGLIFFRADWFDLLAVQGTLKVFSNTIVQKRKFFITQPSLWSDSLIDT